MTEAKATKRQEPVVQEPVVITMTPAAVPQDLLHNNDQLSRIEEKTARIEEKFSRQEAVIGRAQDALDRAAERVETAARSVDAVELANEVAALRARVDKTPRFATLMLASLVTAVATTVLLIAVLKFAPGLLK
jgi:predicted ribosome quality control (RQC) complex YloA/Tae2 family protein